jgi:hypothetical protein
MTFGAPITGPGVSRDGRDKKKPGKITVQWTASDDCRASGLRDFTIEQTLITPDYKLKK